MMKIITIIKTAVFLAALSLTSLSLVSCDGGSEASSDIGDSSIGGSNTGPSNPLNPMDQVVSLKRIILAGNVAGDAPINTNSQAEIRINGDIVTQTVTGNNGVISVDVPFGSLLEVRFVPADGVVGFVGNVVFINGNAAPEVATSGRQGVLAGVPPYTFPIFVSNEGGVQILENPSVTQLRGQFVLSELRDITGSKPLQGFSESAIVRIENNRVSIDGVTYIQTEDKLMLDNFELAFDVLENSLEEGLSDFKRLITSSESNPNDVVLFLIGKDGDLGGQIAYAVSPREAASSATAISQSLTTSVGTFKVN